MNKILGNKNRLVVLSHHWRYICNIWSQNYQQNVQTDALVQASKACTSHNLFLEQPQDCLTANSHSPGPRCVTEKQPKLPYIITAKNYHASMGGFNREKNTLWVPLFFF
jgi:hypothetical protein